MASTINQPVSLHPRLAHPFFSLTSRVALPFAERVAGPAGPAGPSWQGPGGVPAAPASHHQGAQTDDRSGRHPMIRPS